MRNRFTVKIKTLQRIISLNLNYNITVSEIYSLASLFSGLLHLPLNKRQAANYLMRSHRTTRKLNLQNFIEKLMVKFNLFNSEIIVPLIDCKHDDSNLYKKRVFILKEKNNTERGVLIISFDVFGQLRANYDIDKILSDYHLILEPSWSGYCAPEILQFIEYRKSRIIVQAAERMDYDFITRIGGNLIPIDIGSSNWVDDRVFRDLKLEKEYDCIMVAIWAGFKRHHLLFKALKGINDPTYRVCLIGVPWGGRTKKDIGEMADYYGIKDNIEIFERITPEEVNVLLNKSKVNLLLSLKEGANRGIFEGFFANIPGIVLKQNRGVNKSYLNKHSGMLIDSSELKNILLWFRNNYAQFKPREWALQNISCKISTAKLEEKLKIIAKELSEPWTTPISIKVNRPEFEYYDKDMSLKPFNFKEYEKTPASH